MVQTEWKDMDVDFEELAIFLETLDKSGFSHFMYEKGDLRIEVSTQPIPPAQKSETVEAPSAVQPKTTESSPTPAVAPEIKKQIERQPSDVDVKAPLLGTVYFSPKPGEPRFAEIGSKVSAGSTLCIIEVMKLMNSVEAPVEGTIVDINFADGELVEFGQVIFTIRPTGN